MKKVAVALVAALIAGAGAYWVLRSSTFDEASPEAAQVQLTEPAPAPALASQTVTETATSVAAPAPAAEAEKFSKKIESTQAGLPTLAKVKALKTEEVHAIPSVVLQAGVQIADIADAIEKDPSLAPQGIDFYSKCARRADLPVTVRTVCLSGLRDLGKQTRTAVDETGIDAAVTKLTNKMKSGN